MKKILFLFTLLLSVLSFSQDMPASVDEVINWNFKVVYGECDDATVVITVNQKDGWHVYAQKQPEGAASMPTEFIWESSDKYELVGKTKEYGTELHEGQFPEKIFPGSKATFKQKIKIKSKKDFKINLKYTYMACKESCFPPEFDTPATIDVKGVNTDDCGGKDGSEVTIQDTVEISNNELGINQSLANLIGTCEGFNYKEDFKPVRIYVFNPTRTDLKNYTLSLKIEIDSIFGIYAFNRLKGYKSTLSFDENEKYKLIDDISISPSNYVINSDTTGYKFSVQINQRIELSDTNTISKINSTLNIYLFGCENNFKVSKPVQLSFNLDNSIDNGTRSSKKSFWLIFILAFLGGLLALMTPCVFPMIPMTVTFFTKQSKTKSEGIRKAIFYSISIIAIYVLLGVLVSSIFGETALNEMATNPWVNIGFFLLFVVFAISFLGAFEIQLPTSWVNNADKNADKGGMIGIFFMAFTLALVSFSCTGPIVGSVLVQSAQGGLTGPIIAMLGFSLALALPFGLFAAFPGWLNSMPSSGGWLNTVKVTLGFLELAFALKFLSNADLVKQWHLLDREVFLAIWIAIFTMLFIYLIGKLMLPHDSPIEKLSVGRVLFALSTLFFIIYLLPGMWGAPTKIVSGFLPPATYSESPYGIHGEAPELDKDLPESAFAHGHGITTIRDYYEALEYAKKVNKPLMIDFTGWACQNCRLMEHNVWADESVAPILADKFVIASLYVDDRKPLTDENLGKPMINGKTMQTVGDRWMDLSIRKYQAVTQPLYVVVDHNENNISGEATYKTHGTPDLFKNWLENALKKFESSSESSIIVPDFIIIK